MVRRREIEMQTGVTKLLNYVPKGLIWKLGAESEWLLEASATERSQLFVVTWSGSGVGVWVEVRWRKMLQKEQRPRN